MRAQLRCCPLLSSALVIFTFSVRHSAAQPAPDTAALDRFISEQMIANRVPGLALAITRGDRALYVKGYGAARDNQPVTPETQFFLASVSKSFTALAVMQLAEAGKIDLDAPVQTYLREFTLADPEAASRITVRQLLNQVSGLADADFPESRRPQPATIQARVESLRSAHPVAAPGSEFHYFNPNYGVLARLVEVTGEQPFPEYLETHVFAPLQMAHTFSVTTSSEALRRADRLAQGHLVAYGFPFAYPEMAGYLGGSGGVISTAEDMAHYLVMQNSGGQFAQTRLLSPEGVKLMHTPPPNINSNYGMGWFETSIYGRRVLEHNGIISTFYAEMVLLPEQGYGIVLLYNEYSAASAFLAFPRIKRGVIALLLGEQPQTGGLGVRAWGVMIGALTLLSVTLALRSLLRLPRWRRELNAKPKWRLALGIGWALVPALVLLALPSLVAIASDRVFEPAQLFRAMPGVVIWLGLWAVLGVLNGTARLVFWARRAQRSKLRQNTFG